MFFLVFNCGISTTMRQILISLYFSIHPSKGAHLCSGKSLFELSEAFIHFIGVLKNNCSEKFCILPSKTSMVEYFLSTLKGLPETFPKSSLEQLFC